MIIPSFFCDTESLEQRIDHYVKKRRIDDPRADTTGSPTPLVIMPIVDGTYDKEPSGAAAANLNAARMANQHTAGVTNQNRASVASQGAVCTSNQNTAYLTNQHTACMVNQESLCMANQNSSCIANQSAAISVTPMSTASVVNQGPSQMTNHQRCSSGTLVTTPEGYPNLPFTESYPQTTDFPFDSNTGSAVHQSGSQSDNTSQTYNFSDAIS